MPKLRPSSRKGRPIRSFQAVPNQERSRRGGTNNHKQAPPVDWEAVIDRFKRDMASRYEEDDE